MHHTAQILADDVELNVHDTSHLEGMEVGMLVSIRNDGHLETIVGRIAYSQTYSIDGYGPLVHGHVTSLRHLLVEFIFKGEIPASFGILDVHTFGGLIHMALHNVSVQTSVHHHATFYVHLIAHLQQTDV